jgi:transformation/transcription domain-associated protein
VSSAQYPLFLEHAINIFVRLLQEGEPQFISEHNMQTLRKLILEIIHRLPTNEALRPHHKNILSLMFRLLEVFFIRIHFYPFIIFSLFYN